MHCCSLKVYTHAHTSLILPMRFCVRVEKTETHTHTRTKYILTVNRLQILSGSRARHDPFVLLYSAGIELETRQSGFCVRSYAH